MRGLRCAGCCRTLRRNAQRGIICCGLLIPAAISPTIVSSERPHVSLTRGGRVLFLVVLSLFSTLHALSRPADQPAAVREYILTLAHCSIAAAGTGHSPSDVDLTSRFTTCRTQHAVGPYQLLDFLAGIRDLSTSWRSQYNLGSLHFLGVSYFVRLRPTHYCLLGPHLDVPEGALVHARLISHAMAWHVVQFVPPGPVSSARTGADVIILPGPW
ncbi:hypothetical protein BV20DRAFT_309147 [Pilatotrama ljubarskyi]|nr:hypothetical protein BV20DRAFT_309147 [Pilatotrama ljubarskyi]